MSEVKKTRRELAEKVRKDIFRYQIKNHELERGCDMTGKSVINLKKETPDHLPYLNTLEKVDSYIDKHYRKKRVLKEDSKIFVSTTYVSTTDFLRAFFDNYEELRKHLEFRIYEDNLKNLGVIENLGKQTG